MCIRDRCYGERDEQRKRHASIVPWSCLSEKDRKKDKDQISTLKAQFESNSPTAGKPLTIGLIGHTNIIRPQAYSCGQQLEKKLNEISELESSGISRWLDLVSPLAPGSDIAMVHKIIDLLQNGDYSFAGVRLLVPYAVPWEKVDEEFKSHWCKNNQWLEYQDRYTPTDNNLSLIHI